jgi:hypothetical protein
MVLRCYRCLIDEGRGAFVIARDGSVHTVENVFSAGRSGFLFLFLSSMQMMHDIVKT